VVPCPKCTQKLRFPERPNTIRVKCTVCGHEFDYLGTNTASDSGSPSKPLELEEEEGALFWFNAKEIGDTFYGALAYKQLLPHFRPASQRHPGSWWVFQDGDYDPSAVVELPSSGSVESQLIARAKEIGDPGCYIVAVYGQGATSLTQVGQQVRQENAKGYLGKTTLPGDDSWINENGLRRFRNYCNQLSLESACRIEGAQFNKLAFSFVGDESLRSMGFEPREAPTLGSFLKQLVDIYAQHKSFVNAERTRGAKAVGKLIHNYYGFKDMRRVCTELGTTVRGNAAAELNSVWDGIGGWQR
jgi:hypothetical protein